MALSFIGSAVASNLSGAAATLTLPALAIGDLIVVHSLVTRSGAAQAVTSSTGAIYTSILAPVGNSGNTAFLAIRQRTARSTGEVTVTCSGTGNAQDVTCVAAHIFRDSNGGSFQATTNSTTGTSTTPDSASVTARSTGSIVMSAFGAPLVDAAVTAPTSYLGAVSTTNTDTRSATIAAAYVTAGSAGSFNPTSWSNLTSAAWVATTLCIDPIPNWFAPIHPEIPVKYWLVEKVGY